MLWIVLTDIGTDWPEVFGPYSHIEDARRYADEIKNDRRVLGTEVQALIAGDEIEQWRREADELRR
jgi:hypothetical protein